MTSGSAGIGREIARKPASEGADITVADINPAEGPGRSWKRPGNGFSAKVDVSDAAQVNVFAGEVRDTLGPVDILVDNAAIVPLADFDNATFKHWKHTFAINADGPFLTAKAFLGDLKHSDADRVIKTQRAYWTTPPPIVPYVSSRAPLNGLTRAGGESGRP